MTDVPYCLIADMHCHAWSPFSKVQTNGINSRLGIILDELVRAAEELRKRGGDRMYIAGDLVHTRGSMDPEVFNPLHRTIKQIAENGIKIFIIPGNHDLKGRDTTELGNAIQTLGEIEGVTVCTVPTVFAQKIIMIPWQATKDLLRAQIKRIPLTGRSEIDLIMHVGIDGVLPGVPPTGLSSEEVASWGFKRVFAGDYHNFKEMEGGKVYSIGATTHQQWGDIGSKAGFLMVYPDRVEFCASHAPSFIELTDEDDPDEYAIIVDQNYVRIRGFKLTDAEINGLRTELTDMGAKGVSFQVTRNVVTARAGGAATKSMTLDESVHSWAEEKFKEMDAAELVLIQAAAADILSTVRAVEA
jgi:DNA repair exonuclease SbcCD nuclease subunit